MHAYEHRMTSLHVRALLDAHRIRRVPPFQSLLREIKGVWQVWRRGLAVATPAPRRVW